MAASRRSGNWLSDKGSRGAIGWVTADPASAIDEGALAIPSYLPHYIVSPVRNWPGPRIVWDLLAELVQPLLSPVTCRC